jgi:thiamine biosynthesis lipoprotein
MAHLNRRARPLLGTLVEIGCKADHSSAVAVEAAFSAVARVQARMSRFDADSDIGRFNALPAGGAIPVDPWTADVLAAAHALQRHSGGRFDISLGSGPQGWRLAEGRLHKLQPATLLDLGGIAKGFAVDMAIGALMSHGIDAGWVNAGGDLRVFGPIELPVQLRDEVHGGIVPMGLLADGALCTSRFPSGAHVSVAAPQCLWADALTKLVALDIAETSPLLQAHGAMAWRH